MLQDKVRVLTENYYNMDAEMSKKIIQLEADIEKQRHAVMAGHNTSEAAANENGNLGLYHFILTVHTL